MVSSQWLVLSGRETPPDAAPFPPSRTGNNRGRKASLEALSLSAPITAPVRERRYVSWSRVDETPSARRSRRRPRRAGGARGRVARARAPGRARGAGGGVSGPRRAPCRAGARGLADA